MVCRNNLRTISTMYPLSTAHRISVPKSDRQYTKGLDLPQNAGQVSSCGLLSCRLRPRQFLDLFDTNKPMGRLIPSQKFTHGTISTGKLFYHVSNISKTKQRGIPTYYLPIQHYY